MESREDRLHKMGNGEDGKGVSEPTLSETGNTFEGSKSASVWTICGSALANFSDGYQQSIASSTNVILNHLLTTKVYTSAIQTQVSNALLVGSIIGILALGYTSDLYSRKSGMAITSFLVIIGTLLSTLTFQIPPSSSSYSNILWYLTIARGIAGVGVGGEYPTSAAAALESSNEHFSKRRGPIQVAISTLMATSGGPVCTITYLLALIISNNNLKVAFHAMYSIATILPLLVICFRLRMTDSLLFRTSNFKKGGIPWKILVKQKKYLLRLAGTSTAFFLYDFINFPNSIMSAAIINSIVPGKNVRTVAIWQLVLAILPIPGVLVGIYLVNKLGRRWTGILGFAGYIVTGFFIGGFYAPLTTNTSLIPLFVVLYGFMQAFGHMGPGATIGLMSVESFPTAIRGIAYGVSAGFGKAGAAVGTQVFTPIQEAAGKEATFYLAGGVGILGCVVYWFLPEMRDVDLGVMDEEFEGDLKRDGWLIGDRERE